ncbi:OsmC family protein [Thalassorhabdus alkalitolerans]|uniref:OsmC family protein n=1 Tax=Thalassorhabdus alkalitolerans TaxID=2282697 RepID=A0ABW0YM61_9BACI|nr:OsmC family protein [Thalassobacillus sp. C254]
MKFIMQEQGFSTETEFGSLQISGNEKYGFRPYQLLVSSIAVCSGGVLRKVLEKKRIEVRDITVDADVTRNNEGAQEIQKVHLHFVINAPNANDEQIKKSLEVTRKNCSMVQSVQESIHITESFELV